MSNRSFLVLTSNRTINRAPYLLTGLLLSIVKFVIDWTISTQLFGRPWSPLNYLIWPNDRAVHIFELDNQDRAFSIVMLFVSLPFIWTGIILSLRRLRAVGLPLGLVLLFFVPLLNLLLFLVLMVLPTRKEAAAGNFVDNGSVLDALRGEADSLQPRGIMRNRPRPVGHLEPLRRMHRNVVQESYWRSGLVSLAITVPLTVLAVVLGAEVFQSYGFSLFVGAPFAVGMISVLLFGYSQPKPFPACVGVAFSTAGIAGLIILLIALEGFICLIMAAPIAFILVFLGAVVGYVIQSRAWLGEQVPNLTMALLIVLPSIMAAEWVSEPEPAVRALSTKVIIDAPPETVWQHVIAFPPLAEPDDWIFHTGVAYPQRAEIYGTGVGAVRHCVFSTGTFVEPIEVWDPPKLLRFSVKEQPEPMREWSPYQIHPAHLDHYLLSRQGQFLLEALPDGRTRLIGTTWNSNRMWPAPYWNLWSDAIIHRIHGRVLEHIKKLAEEAHVGTGRHG